MRARRERLALTVSGEGFFRSVEFQSKGAYVFRFYKLVFDRLPEYTEVVSDMSFVAGPDGRGVVHTQGRAGRALR